MSDSKQDLIDKNRQSINVLEQSLERLKDLRDEADATDGTRITAQISRTSNQITRLKIINENLIAAETVVAPLSDGEQKELDGLAAKLDQAIEEDAVQTANLEFLKELFTAAQRIGAITGSHTT